MLPNPTLQPLPSPLPKYPAEVTEGTGLTTNTKDKRSPEEYIKTILQLSLTSERYTRDRYGTKCNFYARDCLKLLGIDLPRLVANDMVKEFRSGHFGFQKMLIQDALTNVGLGCPTVAALPDLPHGHIVMVLPTPATIIRGDVLVAQAGGTNFYGRPMKYSWPQHQLGLVEFFGAP